MQKTGEHTNGNRLDARAAFLVLLMYSCSLFFIESWVGIAWYAAVLVVASFVWRVPMKRILTCLVPLAFVLACTVIAQIPHGIEAGLFYAVRIALLAVATCVVAFSYSSNQFVKAFSRLLGPLRAARVPVDDIATMFSVALRCIPGCAEEAQRVASAQRSRASRFDEGGLVSRVQAWSRVFVPMVVGLFRNAEALAQAMEARCYGAKRRRTSLHGNERLSALDWAALAFCAVACIAVSFVF